MVDEYDIRVSARRKKTASARMENGRLVVTVPAHLSVKERIETAATLSSKFWATRNDDLLERAVAVKEEFLPELDKSFTLRWVDNQTTRWASCSTGSGAIRVSSRLRRAPGWVLDAVILHELSHLIEPSHNKAFKELIGRNPRTRDADIFLEGFTLGLSS